MKTQSAFICYLFLLFSCRSEELFTSNQVNTDETLKIINAYLEHEYLPVNEKNDCRKSTDMIKVMDTLMWRSHFISEKVEAFLIKNNFHEPEDPVVLSGMNSKYPFFFQNRIQLVKTIDHEDWCGSYHFSPAFRTANENEYFIQIFFESFEMDYGFVYLFEFENNSFRIKKDVDGWVNFF